MDLLHSPFGVPLAGGPLRRSAVPTPGRSWSIGVPTSSVIVTFDVPGMTWAASDPGGPRPFRSDFERDLARRTLPG